MTSNATEIHDKTYWCALNRNWHYVCDMWITSLTMIWLKGPIFMMFWNCSYMSRRVNWPVWKSEGISEGGWSEGVTVCGSDGVREWRYIDGLVCEKVKYKSEEVRVCRVRVWWNDVQESDRVREWGCVGVLPTMLQLVNQLLIFIQLQFTDFWH